MKNIRFILLLALIVTACKDDKSAKQETPKEIEEVFDDSAYVLDDNYPVGDARRYGVTAETARLKHPHTGDTRLETIMDLAENQGIEMQIPSGYYKMNLIIDSRKNLNLRFNNSEFDLIQIIKNKDSLSESKNINLKGTLISNDKVSITASEDIAIDSILIRANTLNLRKSRPRGCQIYYGSKDIKIGYLEVDDLGSDTAKDKYTHAALAVDGWNNNPINVDIGEIHIKSSDRHGIYLTGSDHVIGKVLIDKFGMGSSDGMDPMQDAKIGEEKEFKALWINKCYNTFIESITINEENSKGKYTAHFDAGDKQRPVIIEKMIVKNDNAKISILEEESNGVIVEIMENQ
ncbi:hypothetical protein J4050_00585 [Winogradskyella sp. DF17]|uniref:Uncharacterized protein n=1 Tax=Winogradskyella pelagia TaxID=2819984 RepID=A0ABS3SXK4_9FLAO|nr:hypothetical protein [Winogradskyella sp. DF17]MBO3115221.1 hypothetical protein [Winogradskyella sp. DF17]